MIRDAILSDCGTYRYRLERRWSDEPPVAFVMLNPSTADALQDDPTIRRCIGFAKSWGYGGLIVGNLFALRSTDPSALLDHRSPVGPGADAYLARIVLDARATVCAWGAHKMARERGREVLAQIETIGRRPMALRITKEGAPSHPLYLPADLHPIPFTPAGREALQHGSER